MKFSIFQGNLFNILVLIIMKAGKDQKITQSKIIKRQDTDKGKNSSTGFKDHREKSAQLKSIQQMADESPKIQKNQIIQQKVDNQQINKANSPVNKTGLPNQLKSGIENLSGQTMDDVKVHRNSSIPAQLNAHAFAQGSNIHLAAGQEKHLPHEAWHVVQQKQGRVKPTIKINGGVAINDNKQLENEADAMGAKASGFKGIQRKVTFTSAGSEEVAQRVPDERKEYETIVAFFNDRAGLSDEADQLLDNLGEYVSLGNGGSNKELISQIHGEVTNKGIMSSLKAKTIALDPKSGKEKWALMAHHLKSATVDELREYDSFASRWMGRTNKWAVTGSTLGVQSSMQYLMGNTVSASAFATRAVLHEINLLITNAVHLSHKMEYAKTYVGIEAGVSELMEVSKFFETWTASGLIPSLKDAKSTSEKLRFAANYIKKSRAGLVAIMKGVSYLKFKGTAPIIKYINDAIGSVELILNSLSIGDKNFTEDVVNNVAKGIRHLLDHILAAIKALISLIKRFVAYVVEKNRERRAGTDQQRLIDNQV